MHTEPVPERALTAPGSPSSSSAPDPATDCASPGSTVWDARSESCSKPSTASRLAAGSVTSAKVREIVSRKRQPPERQINALAPDQRGASHNEMLDVTEPRATQVALGGAERVGQGGARIPAIQPVGLGKGARRVGPGVLGVEPQADGDAGPVLRHVLDRQRTGSGARSAHRPRMKRESLAFRPSRVGIPSQTRAGQDPTSSADVRQSPGIKTSTAHAPRQLSAPRPDPIVEPLAGWAEPLVDCTTPGSRHRSLYSSRAEGVRASFWRDCRLREPRCRPRSG